MGRFDMGEFAKTLQQANVSNSDTGREQIEYIDIDLLDADEKNFYELSGLEELAANIELVGLQQPLRVRADPDRPGRYTIVSGHRRRAALQILVDAGRTELREIPCIRERSAGSAALQELRLIYANSDTRKLSSADLSKQAERVEMLLYQLKEEGIEFPGRMRDHVAEACKVSKTKLARLKVIRENLIPEFAKHYEKGDLKESSAYTLAQQPAEMQQLVWKYMGPGEKKDMSHLSEWQVANEIGRIKPVLERTCRKQAGGPPCSHRDALLEKLFDGTYSYKPCDRICCDKCDKLRSCKSACPLLAEKAKKLKADHAAQSKQEKLAQQERDQPTIDAISEYWRRLAAARAAAGKSVKELFKATGAYYSMENDEQWLKKEALQKIKRDDFLPFGMYGIRLHDAEKIRATADLLGVTTDYLLCRTDDSHGEKGYMELEFLEPGEAPAELVRWENRGRTPPIGALILTYDLTNAGPVLRPAVWDGTNFHAPGKPDKKLPGLQFTQWLHIPMAHSGETYQLAPDSAADAGQTAGGDIPLRWRSPQEPPEDGSFAVAKFQVTGAPETMRSLVRRSGGRWCFPSGGATIDAECIGWWPIPVDGEAET
mgnify:CR=1 FL=1